MNKPIIYVFFGLCGQIALWLHVQVHRGGLELSNDKTKYRKETRSFVTCRATNLSPKSARRRSELLISGNEMVYTPLSAAVPKWRWLRSSNCQVYNLLIYRYYQQFPLEQPHWSCGQKHTPMPLVFQMIKARNLSQEISESCGCGPVHYQTDLQLQLHATLPQKSSHCNKRPFTLRSLLLLPSSTWNKINLQSLYLCRGFQYSKLIQATRRILQEV